MEVALGLAPEVASEVPLDAHEEEGEEEEVEDEAAREKRR